MLCPIAIFSSAFFEVCFSSGKTDDDPACNLLENLFLLILGMTKYIGI